MKKSILVVDDHDGIRKAMGILLSDEFPKYKIILASNVEDAIKKAKPELKNIELICTDGELGSSELDSGWHLAEQLRKKGYKKRIIYIAMTPLPDKYSQLFDEILPKGDPEQVINILKKYLN